MKKRITLAEVARYSEYQTTFAVYDGFPLLSVESAQFYHAGVYGWNFDFWIFNGFNIISGYRYNQKKFKTIPREELLPWIQLYNNAPGWEERKKLLERWIDEVNEKYVKGESK